VELNSFLLKVNRLSTKKKDSKMNLKDALIAEEQENSKEEDPVAAVVASVAVETEMAAEKVLVAAIDGRIQGKCLNAFPLFILYN
jgi:hypothetical protein